MSLKEQISALETNGRKLNERVKRPVSAIKTLLISVKKRDTSSV